jgi:predicted DsbA family dithiol-disulfide isomerase
MTVHVHYFTDPACSASWAAEPSVRKLMVEFGPDLSFRPVMGGLARDYEHGHEFDYSGLLVHWLDRAANSGMPLDARLWSESPIRTTYPACMAVKAAAEQGPEAAWRYLRVLREGLLCFRHKLDTTEALVEEARRAGLDVARFRVDLASNAIVEAFGADLELTRSVPDVARERGGVVQGQGGERVAFPSGRFGEEEWVFGLQPYEAWRGAAIAGGAQPTGEPPPDVMAALRRFGRMAAVEVSTVCDLPGPRAEAELWRLVADWKVKATRVLTGFLFEVA